MQAEVTNTRANDFISYLQSTYKATYSEGTNYHYVNGELWVVKNIDGYFLSSNKSARQAFRDFAAHMTNR
ncbi:hypothetical protein [Parashewanella tropica]|uniref:hypothetical protein n=1 Tax=Parashewanella tropica TaxID=2547970 RepID=UPI0010598FEA|nr:hypothetical protein [Parashewanella tropica]